MTNIKRKNSKIRHMGLFLILAGIIPVFIQKYETFNYHTIEPEAVSSVGGWGEVGDEHNHGLKSLSFPSGTFVKAA